MTKLKQSDTLSVNRADTVRTFCLTAYLIPSCGLYQEIKCEHYFHGCRRTLKTMFEFLNGLQRFSCTFYKTRKWKHKKVILLFIKNNCLHTQKKKNKLRRDFLKCFPRSTWNGNNTFRIVQSNCSHTFHSPTAICFRLIYNIFFFFRHKLMGVNRA